MQEDVPTVWFGGQLGAILEMKDVIKTSLDKVGNYAFSSRDAQQIENSFKLQCKPRKM